MNDEKTHKETLQAIRNASQEQLQELAAVALGMGAKQLAAPLPGAAARRPAAGQTPAGAEHPAAATPPDVQK